MRDIGLAPKHWMKLERMVVARRKLAGGQSPEEVASDLGFMSAPSFARQFQEFYKISRRAIKRTAGHWVIEGVLRVRMSGGAGAGLSGVGC